MIIFLNLTILSEKSYFLDHMIHEHEPRAKSQKLKQM